MSRKYRKWAEARMMASQPPPPEVEQAFAALDALDRCHPETRGCNPASLILPPDRANRSTLTGPVVAS